ncbi:hypothetical protein SLA2020_445590 [Shorea laevis]
MVRALGIFGLAVWWWFREQKLEPTFNVFPMQRTNLTASHCEYGCELGWARLDPNSPIGSQIVGQSSVGVCERVELGQTVKTKSGWVCHPARPNSTKRV